MLIFVVIIILLITIFTNGNPIEKAKFRKEIKNYLSETYSNMNWRINSIDYSFKEGDFSATVLSDKGITFLVYENNFRKLDDNYVSSVWMNEIKTATTKKAEEIVGSKAEVIVDIFINGKGIIENNNNIPSYSNVEEKVASSTTLSVTAAFSESKSYSQIMDIISWIKENKYYAETYFDSKMGIYPLEYHLAN
ncbi:hypothetical protein [Paenibacillus macerans]|uniref:YfjL-like protein n=1 Tax=Paenibacillus macerans TaxID=44252 RepID=UPI0020418F0D|nr:hypothetical protein [Paenibacillus macerans]MCM3702485.1 hypothetical protein [Paenibacillus macerans]